MLYRWYNRIMDFVEKWGILIIVCMIIITAMMLTSCKSSRKTVEINTSTTIESIDSSFFVKTKVIENDIHENVETENEMITIIETIKYCTDTIYADGHQPIQEIQRKITASSAKSLLTFTDETKQEEKVVEQTNIETKAENVIESKAEQKTTERSNTWMFLKIGLCIALVIAIIYKVINFLKI